MTPLSSKHNAANSNWQSWYNISFNFWGVMFGTGRFLEYYCFYCMLIVLSCWILLYSLALANNALFQQSALKKKFSRTNTFAVYKLFQNMSSTKIFRNWSSVKVHAREMKGFCQIFSLFIKCWNFRKKYVVDRYQEIFLHTFTFSFT